MSLFSLSDKTVASEHEGGGTHCSSPKSERKMCLVDRREAIPCSLDMTIIATPTELLPKSEFKESYFNIIKV